MNLDAFAVTEQIGRGACSQVLRAIRKHDSAHVVLKCCSADSIASNMMTHFASEGGRPILKEVFFLKKLQNIPGCVKMLDHFYDEANNQYVIVLEDLVSTGFTKLTQELLHNDGFLNEYSISWIMRELIHTVKQLHDYNILHCDIKPDNIFIHRAQKTIKLVDFNIAMELVPSEFPELDPKSIGCTPEYTPPEVLIQKRLWTPASEIWSLGVTAFVLLCKKFPFADPYLSHRMQPAYPEDNSFGRERGYPDDSRYSRDSSESVSVRSPHISIKAKDFLLCCLHKRPECRPNFQRLTAHVFLTITPPRTRTISTDSIPSTDNYRVSAKAS